MKKSLYILSVITLLFSSCVNSSYNKQEEEQNAKSQFPIVGFVEEFVATHPNFDNNNITREQADEANAISVESLTIAQSQANISPYQAFVDAAAIEVEAKTGYNPYDVSMHVYTTMDVGLNILSMR